MQNKLLLRVALIIALGVFMQLAHVCLVLSKTHSPGSSEGTLINWWNPFHKVATKPLNDREVVVAEARRRLDFMTFSHERSIESRRVLGALQAQINLQPFSSIYWAEYVALQADAKEPARDRVWAMSRALHLAGWNHKYRLAISARCLEQPPALFETGLPLCRQLLGQLPYSDLGTNARYMGVESNFLKQRLLQLNRLYPLGLSK